jgi:Skp family chaperone for outer membrane proteins
MKVLRIVLVTFIFAGLTVAVLARTRFTTNNNAINSPNIPPTAPPASGIAIIDTSEFTQEKTGITRVNAALAKIDSKYQGVRKELQDMRSRLNALRTDIQNKGSVQDPKITAQQTEQADQLELQIKRKTEDAQNAYQKESMTAMSPLQADIQTAIGAYAKAHGILLVIDAYRVPLVYADTTIDITNDFIAEYNKTHPATPAAPAKP